MLYTRVSKQRNDDLFSFSYLVGQSECQRRAGHRGTVGYRSQDQAGLAQELTGQRLEERGACLQGFGG